MVLLSLVRTQQQAVCEAIMLCNLQCAQVKLFNLILGQKQKTFKMSSVSPTVQLESRFKVTAHRPYFYQDSPRKLIIVLA